MKPQGPVPSSVASIPVSNREILRFYLPLVLTSQMMSLSGPLVNAGIGRSGDPTVNFAGYWLGFAVLLFLQSPCMVVQQVAATLVTGVRSVQRVFIISVVSGAIATALILAVALTPLGESILGALIPTTERVASLARSVLVIFSPIPLLISIRGVANGLAIREKRTDLIARATFIRLVILSTVVGACVLFGTGSGALAGASAVVAGISFETLIVVLATRTYVVRRHRERRTYNPDLTYRFILRVAAPLVVAAIVWTIARPIVNAILGLLPDPEVAQAGFGIILPLVLVTSSPLWAIQNVSLVLPETKKDLRVILRFGVGTVVLFSSAILILVLTPLREIVLMDCFDLSPDLARQVRPAIYLIAAEPIFLGARCFAQGLLMKAKRTEAFLVFSPVKVLFITAAGFFVVSRFPGVNGAVLGTALFLGGDLFDSCVYGWKALSFVRQGILFGSEAEATPETTRR